MAFTLCGKAGLRKLLPKGGLVLLLYVHSLYSRGRHWKHCYACSHVSLFFHLVRILLIAHI
jgi:hypothetical protein